MHHTHAKTDTALSHIPLSIKETLSTDILMCDST